MLLGWLFVVLFEPFDGWMGVLLIGYGIWLADLDRSLNPTPPEADVGPHLPWNEMHVGDRLAYFFPAISIMVVSVMALVLVGLLLSDGQGNWMALGFGAVILASGLLVGWDAWKRRWDAVEAE